MGWGHGSNNSGRFHTREQAVNFDQRCIEIVREHPHGCFVPYTEHIDEKLHKVRKCITDALESSDTSVPKTGSNNKVLDPRPSLSTFENRTASFFSIPHLTTGRIP